MGKNKKLGSNPLDSLGWIGNSNPNQKNKTKDGLDKPLKKEKRETFIVRTDLTEKIKDYAYWERIKQKDVINLILESFFKDNPVKQRPDESK